MIYQTYMRIATAISCRYERRTTDVSEVLGKRMWNGHKNGIRMMDRNLNDENGG